MADINSIKNMCRACLTTKESFNYVLCENVPAEVFCFCTSIDINDDEELPKTICNSCYELLDRYTSFKRTCIQSQNTLISLRDSLKLENDVIDTFCEDNVKKDIDIKIEECDDVEDDVMHDDDTDYVVNIKKTETKIKKKKRKLKIKEHKKVKVKRGHFSYTCEICSKKFKYEDRYETHKLLHQGKTASINCKLCNKTFMTWSGHQRHTISEHTPVKLDTLKCTQCGKIFKNKETLKIHLKLHLNSNKSLYVCDICGKNFSTRFVLKGHLQIHNENRERTYSCEHCGKKFFNNGVLVTHVARAHAGRRYHCQVCNYPFTDKYNLSKHLLIHEGIKNYKCDICEKQFGTQHSLVIHKRTHSGERPYLCNYCPKAFISKSRLMDHVRIHTGERPFRCGVCNQAYTQRGSLKRHMKVHNKPPLIGM